MNRIFGLCICVTLIACPACRAPRPIDSTPHDDDTIRHVEPVTVAPEVEATPPIVEDPAAEVTPPLVLWPDSDPLDPEPNTVFGNPIYAQHDPAHNLLLTYKGFTVYYDDMMLSPRWTAIKITRESADANSDMNRPGRFKSDPRLAAVDLAVTNHDDYLNPPGRHIWDRGHIVQFDDARGWGTQAGEDSFFTTNICPQIKELNQRGWLALEKRCTEYARDYGTVWIYAGPVLNTFEALVEHTPFDASAMPIAGFVFIGPDDGLIPLPTSFYKIVIRRGDDDEMLTQSFIMPNEPVSSGADMTEFQVSIDDIENVTHIDFLPELPDEVEAAVESAISDLWPDLP